MKPITFTAHCKTGMQMIEEAILAAKQECNCLPGTIHLSTFWAGQLQQAAALMIEGQEVQIEYRRQAKYTIKVMIGEKDHVAF